MTSRSHLGWPVPCSVWERHLEHVREKWDATDLYAGVEAEQIVKLWERIETTDAADLSGPTEDPPKKNEKKDREADSETRLEDQEKEYVQVSFNDDVADTVRSRAKQYDVNNGVMFAYMLREYYDTDGWGYSIEAVGSGSEAATDDGDDVPEVPYREADKVEWIADRLREKVEESGEKKIYAWQIKEVVERAGASSRIDHYRDAVLDEISYVHHPDESGVYITALERYEKFDVQDDDPAIYRKPYDELTTEEKVEGIKAILSARGVGMPVSRIHEGIFDGNGSTRHIRDLAEAAAQDEAATFNKTSGGTKILRVAPCGYPPEPDPEAETEDDEDSEQDETASEPEPEPETTPTTETAQEPTQAAEDDEDDIRAAAEAELAALDQATPARPDGGTVE